MNRYQGKYLWLGSLIGLCSVIFSSAMAIELSEESWKQLARGQVIVMTEKIEGMRRVEAAVLIAQPPETIWQTMLDCASAPEFVPSMQRCTVLKQFPEGENAEPEWQVIEHEVRYGWLAPKTIYQFRADYETHRHISFMRISGDLNELEGDWRLTIVEPNKPEVPDHLNGFTLVTYSVFIDPGFLVPGFISRGALQNDLPEVMRSLRTRVNAQRLLQESSTTVHIDNSNVE